MLTYLQELHAGLNRISSSIYHEYEQIPTTPEYADLRLLMLRLHEDVFAALAGVGDAIRAYHLIPDEQKAWKRRV